MAWGCALEIPPAIADHVLDLEVTHRSHTLLPSWWSKWRIGFTRSFFRSRGLYIVFFEEGIDRLHADLPSGFIIHQNMIAAVQSHELRVRYARRKGAALV